MKRHPARFVVAAKVSRLLPPLFARKISRYLYPLSSGRRDDLPYQVRAQTGSLYNSTTRDVLGHGFSLVGYNEWRLWAAALYFAPPRATLFEVGANIGTETIGFSDIVGPAGRVVAAEPVPTTVMALRRSIRDARYHNIHIVESALSGGVGSLTIEIDTKQPSRSFVSEFSSGSCDETVPVTVSSTTIDELAAKFAVPDMLFIDVEGWEVSVLQGGSHVLATRGPEIVIEANPSALAANGYSPRDLRDHLASFGYSIRSLRRLGLGMPRIDSFPGYENWICTTRSERLDGFATFLRRCAMTPCLPRVNPLTRPRLDRE
jgi:FkbM family methyltransferase